MKKFLKTGGFCLILGLAFSCTSDDNKGGKSNEEETTLIVLDRMEELQYDSEYNEEQESDELALFSKTTYVFHYDEKGRVAILDVDDLDEIPLSEESHSITKSTLTYNDANQIKSIHTIEMISGENWIDEQFEYNAQGVLVKSVERVDNETKHYQLNEKKQVVSLKVVTDHNYEEHYAYEYDERGNIIRATEIDNSKRIHNFTYDTNKTPYENMSINFTHSNFDYTHYLTSLNVGKNNILSYKDRYGEWVMKHELNAEGYPIESTGSFEGKNKTMRLVYKYTYKSITIKK